MRAKTQSTVTSLLMLLVATAAGAEELAPNMIASLSTRVLAYNRNIASRSGSAFKIAILDRGAPDAAIVQAFKALSAQTLRDLPLRVVALRYRDAETLRLEIAAQNIDALYIATALRSEVAAIVEACVETRTPTIATDEAMVNSGVAIGVVGTGAKREIVINLPAARRTGMDLSSQVLSLSRVIR